MLRADDPDVVTSYRGAYNFQGLVVDALPELRRRKFSHVVFVQDDVLFDPTINQGNIVERLQLRPRGAFLPDLHAFAG